MTGTAPPAYMAALDGLSERGFELVAELRERGREVRQRDREMRSAGGKLARQLEEQLRQLKEKHTRAISSTLEHASSPLPSSVDAHPHAPVLFVPLPLTSSLGRRWRRLLNRRRRRRRPSWPSARSWRGCKRPRPAHRNARRRSTPSMPLSSSSPKSATRLASG